MNNVDDDPLQWLVDRAVITDTINRIALMADLRQWDEVQACFADQVELDYTSLVGGEPATLSPQAIVTSWRSALPGFAATQHLIGQPLITLDGDSATCIAHFQATHRLDTATGGGLWTLGGTYHFGLSRTAQGWKVDRMQMNARWGDGNQNLSEAAAQRAKQADNNE